MLYPQCRTALSLFILYISLIVVAVPLAYLMDCFSIDTSGMFSLTDNVKKLIDLTDLFLLDIKHIVPSKSKELVGFSNELEIEFAKYLSDIR